MKRTLHLLWIIPVLVVTLWSAIPATSDAKPAYEVETFYFSNAAHTTQVGYSHLYCSGGFTRQGKITKYLERYQEPCY